MQADELLQQIALRYRAVEAYQDQGEMVNSVARIRFRTFFQRPRRFRLDWTDEYTDRDGKPQKSRQTICFNDLRGWWIDHDDQSREFADSLETLVARATGVSMGVAQTISPLLTAEVGGFSLSQLIEPTVQETDLEGVPCWEVQGTHPDDRSDRYGFLAEQRSLLIRKITNHTGAGSIESRWRITTDQPIADRVFGLTPAN